jgi:glycosyltransferase involved in cell wall biosynthesis
LSSEILSDKKILYLVKTLDVGGAERFTFNLCKYFVNIFSDVTVFSSGGIFVEELIKSGVNIYNSPLAANNGILNFFLLKRELSYFLKNNHFDIIHCQHRYFVPIIHSLKLNNTKIVYTANNYFNDFYQKLIRADAIVGISPTIFNNLIKTMKAQKGNIISINYGVAEIVKRLPNDDFCIGYIGRIIKEKGIFELLQAIRILKNTYPNIKLLIYGEGKDKNDILNFIKKYDLQDNIELKDISVNLEDIYNRINIMVLPSKMNEGLPLSIIECLINKIIVIATSQGAVKDIIIDGKTGFVIDSPIASAIANKFEYVLKYYEQLEEIKNNAYQLVKEKYSSSQMLEDYHTLYNKLVLQIELQK